MSAVHDGGPAFHSVTCRDGDNYAQSRFVYHRGMSLRDWFAGQALMGWAAGRSNPWGARDESAWVAAECYAYADAMLRAREGVQIGNPTEELPDEHWHKIQTLPSLSWHPTRGWEAACEMRGKMMYGRGKTIAAAQAALRAEWERGAR